MNLYLQLITLQIKREKMKSLLLSTVIFILTTSTTLANISSCGDDSSDRMYPNLTWEKAATYKVNTSFVDLNAIVCVGISYTNLKIKRLHYRDNTGVKRNYSISQLKRSDIVLLKRSDFPGWHYFLASFTGMLLWPLISLLLKMSHSSKHDPNAL